MATDVTADRSLETDASEQRYRAPALEKGLDILELISRSNEPLTVTMMTQALGRSTGELFRMVQVLEFRGFIAAAEGGSGYIPTSKLFALAMAQAPMKSPVEAALPPMRRLATVAEQSCHLALRAGGDIVIAARMESAGLIGFSVRIGYRQPLWLTGSGTVLYAFQQPETRAAWERTFDRKASREQLARFRETVDRVARDGYDVHASSNVPGIVDLSAPVMRGDAAAAALTMPFVRKVPLAMEQDEALRLIVGAAREISKELASSDVRV